MEGALSRVKPFALTRGGGSGSGSSKRDSGLRALAGRDRERQRRPPPTLRAVDKAAAREHHPEWCSALPRNGSGL